MMTLAYFNIDTNQWTLLEPKPDFPVNPGDTECYYDSFRSCTISKKLVIFGRGVGASYFLIYNTVTHAWDDGPCNSWLSETQFNGKSYYSTLKTLADGEKMYIVMRSVTGLKFASFESPQRVGDSPA